MILGDCLEILKSHTENHFDSLVTDPPAGISFMGKEWDGDKGGRDPWINWMTEVMKECLRVMKPGAHGLVWALPRTSHWTATALENAGFEVRDCIYHLHGTGFPKNLNVKKAAQKSGIACVCEEVKAETHLSHLSEALHSEEQSSPLQGEEMQQSMLWNVEISKSRDQSTNEGSIEKSCRDRQPSSQSDKKRNANGAQSGVEGRSNLQADQRELHRSEIFEMSAGISIDGSQGRLHHGTSSGDGQASQPSSQSNRSGASQGSQYPQQSDRESGTIPNQWASQTCGSCGKKIFEEGIGTALKPAVECWWLIRKPCSEKTVAKNVEKWGCGGINIDASRIESPDANISSIHRQSNDTIFQAKGGGRSQPMYNAAGRFPANLVLSHTPECENDICSMFCPINLINRQSDSNVARFFYICGPKNIKAADTFVGKNLESRKENLSIDGFGKKQMAPFLMGTISITEMGTHSIMSFPILNASTKMFTGTITIESGKTIEKSLAENVVGVSVVSTTECFLHFQSGQQEPITGIVSLAFEDISVNGERRIVNIGTPITEPIVATRFRYIAKASKKDRNEGLEGMPLQTVKISGGGAPCPKFTKDGKPNKDIWNQNIHPTVKSSKLMEYLCTLITPPKGKVLDPFMGSGSTGVACNRLGFEFHGIEQNEEYFEIAKKRTSNKIMDQ